MNVILLYQHIGRELYSIKKLESILSDRGHKVYVFSIDYEFDKAIRCTKKTKIDVVVSPWMYHDTNYQDFVPFIKKNPDVKIINLHSEQLYSQYSKNVLLPSRGVVSECVYHLCWGENFKEALLEIDVPEELVYVTGNMRTDEIFGVSYSKKQLADKYDLDEKKEWILFAENRNYVVNEKVIRSELQKKGISEQKQIELYDYTKGQLDAAIDEMNHLDDRFFDRFELIYRAHPGFQGSMGITNIKIKEIADLSIYEWLNASDICVVWNSTCAFESDMFHVPVFVCSKDPIPEIYQTVGLSNYKYISSLWKLMDEDLKEIIHNQGMKKNYTYYYGDVDGNATNNVADAIENIYTRQGSYRAKLIPQEMGYQLRWKCANLLTKVVVKLGLLDLIKYPRSSYQHKSDIPYYVAKR